MRPTQASAQVYLKRLFGIERPTTPREDSVVALARAQLGVRYRWGGERPEVGFDCSGLMRYVLQTVGVDLPRTSAEQARLGVEIPRDILQLRPGDLLMFGRGSRVSHVGIYIGNRRFIHANSVTGRVTEEELPRRWLLNSSWWRGVRRVLASDENVDAERSGG